MSIILENHISYNIVFVLIAFSQYSTEVPDDINKGRKKKTSEHHHILEVKIDSSRGGGVEATNRYAEC